MVELAIDKPNCSDAGLPSAGAVHRRDRCTMTRTIPLTKGYVAIVDDADYEGLSGYKWHAHFTYNNVYATRSVHARLGLRKYQCKRFLMHREILGLVVGDGIQVDHKNRNGLDNRRENLRACTPKQNHGNQMSRSGVSAYKGVSFDKRRQKWRAQIFFDGRQKFLGYHRNEVEAALAYDYAAREHWGLFARTNFPTRFERGTLEQRDA